MSQQLNLPLKTHKSYEASDFYVTNANREAYEYISAWPDWPHFCCILYGERGAGKTHLAKIFQEKAQASCGDLASIRLDDLPEAPALILDNLHFQGEKVLTPAQEKALFHLYNTQKEKGKSLLILTNTPPSSWALQLPDLRSRLRGSPSIQVHSPDDPLLSQLYAKLFADYQVILNPQVIDYIVKNTERSFEKVPPLVEKVVTYALSKRRNITIPLIKEILK